MLVGAGAEAPTPHLVRMRTCYVHGFSDGTGEFIVQIIEFVPRAP